MRISDEGRDALKIKAPRPTVATRLMSGFAVKGKTDCWLWTRSTSDGCGCGKMNVNGETLYTHRLSYELFKGPIPAGKFVLHDCDTPSCGNPDHLYIGTHQQNMQDMVDRKRHQKPRLTKEQVFKVVAMAKAGTKRSAIGATFNINASTVSRIMRGEIHSRITGIKPKAKAKQAKSPAKRTATYTGERAASQ